MPVVVLSKLKHQMRWIAGQRAGHSAAVVTDNSRSLDFAHSLLSTEGAAEPGALQIDGLELPAQAEGGSFKLEPGAKVWMRWTGRCFCTACGEPGRKLMSGYCYMCLTSRAEADTCVMSPESCHYLRGTCREPDWGLSFCFQPHVVYLSYTGAFKVGITRLQQLVYRWCDQGATWAVPLACVGSRHQAGVIEHALKARYSDRTHWQKMLKDGNRVPEAGVIEDTLKSLRSWVEGSHEFTGAALRVACPPVRPNAAGIEWLLARPTSISHRPPEGPDLNCQSISLEKSGETGGELLGFKGQYLFFPTGVLNVRRHEGFEVELSVS